MQVLSWLRRLPPGVRRLLPGLLALALSAELFAYAALGAVDRQLAADSRALAEQIQAGVAPLRQQLRGQGAASDAPVAEAPPALRLVIALAGQTGIRIARLVPRPQADGMLDAEVAARFPDFLRFVAGVEALGGVFQGWQLRAADGEDRAITFTLDMRQPLARPIAALPATGDARLRDPFSIPAPDATAGVTDLSGQHRLTAVTQLGAVQMATIDGRDYLENDTLGDMTITSIQDGAVSLLAGQRRYRLGFGRVGR